MRVALQFGGGIIESAVGEFVRGIVGVLPEVVSGLLFVSLAYVGIRIALSVLRAALDRVYPAQQELVVELFVTVAGVFLWFGVGLTLLKILGMGDVAASLGTATGFIALGVSYALSNTIADTVAGVYLLRDPDYDAGDRVTAAGETGVVHDIGLRKTRIERDDGDRVIMANSKVDAGWVKEAPEAEATEEPEPEADPDPAGEGEDGGAGTLVADKVVSDRVYADEVVTDRVVDRTTDADGPGGDTRATDADASAPDHRGDADGPDRREDAEGPDRRDDSPDDRTRGE